MNYTKSLVGTLAALAVGSSLFAQTAETSASAGLLGQRYVGASLSIEDFRTFDDLVGFEVDSAIGGSLSVNVPVRANLDAGFGYSYDKIDDSVFEATQHAIGAGATVYGSWSGVKPFATATIGYSWTDIEVPSTGASANEDDAFWAAGVGVEVPVGPATALRGRVSYNDSFDSDDGDGSWAFSAGVNHWFTRKVAGVASVTFVEDDSVVYVVGARLRF